VAEVINEGNADALPMEQIPKVNEVCTEEKYHYGQSRHAVAAAFATDEAIIQQGIGALPLPSTGPPIPTWLAKQCPWW
jgi:hypothetical protein